MINCEIEFRIRVILLLHSFNQKKKSALNSQTGGHTMYIA